jgi:hypothetical protein
MAYAQWATFELVVRSSNLTITVRDVNLMWGKFHQTNDKDEEIPAAEIEGKTVDKNRQYLISTCGRSHAASGTEGRFNLYDGARLVAKIYWDCPWASKTNKFILEPQGGEDYMLESSGASLDAGALGNISIKIAKIA